MGFGDANLDPTRDPSNLLFYTDVRCIIIMPMYRLGIFGFLASSELQQEAQFFDLRSGNYGLWDQRLALEWTHANVVGFGGNPRNITIGGYSGGAYSAFLQLQYDLMRPAGDQIIRRVVLQSNGPGVQPVSLKSAQEQFDRVVELCGIEKYSSPRDKLKFLRGMDHRTLVSKLSNSKDMGLVFRPILDSDFAQPSLCRIHNNVLASLAVKRGIKFFMGSVQQEENFYGSQPVVSYEDMLSRLSRTFPLPAVKAVVPHYDVSDTSRKPDYWKRLHGRILADLQVYVHTRGLVTSLQAAGLPLSSVLRYEIRWRVDSTASILPEFLGVTHGTDIFFIWFYNANAGLSPNEQVVIKTWLKPFAAFLRGDDDIEWGVENITDVRVLDSDGTVKICRDQRWEHAISVWDTIGRVTQSTENS
ncbi:hypothetical protein SLS64_011142 [Diaporthe eres]